MRIVYAPPIVVQLNNAIHAAAQENKFIMRFELDPNEMQSLRNYFDKQTFKQGETVINPRDTLLTYLGVPVVEHPFSYFAALPTDEK